MTTGEPGSGASATPAPRRARWAWALYDWAGDGFSAVIIAFVFSAYFTRSLAENVDTGTALWGMALGIAGVAAALSAPLAGAIADRGGPVKPWLAVATLICAAAVPLALILVVLGSYGSELSKVFYNSMLPRLVPAERLGRLSGQGWALGYAGGLACLGLVFFAILGARPGEEDVSAAMRHVGPVVAAWLIVFSLPLFLLTPDRGSTGIGLRRSVREGAGQLRATLADIRRYGNLVRFMIARLVYTDGTGTLFAFGGVYAAGTFDLTVQEVLIFGVALNVAGGIGAMIGGWIDDRLGPRRTILVALAGVVLCGTPLLFVQGQALLWTFGIPVGFFLGPIQPASRSLLSRLAPKGLETQMFGFFATSGKITAFLGPVLVAAVTGLAGSQRAGMSVVIAFFLLGALLLLRVSERPSSPGSSPPA